MKSVLNISLLCLMTFLFSMISVAQHTQEIQLKQAYKKEKDVSKSFMRLLTLGEYYKEYNIYLADSLKQVILQKSYSLGDNYKF